MTAPSPVRESNTVGVMLSVDAVLIGIYFGLGPLFASRMMWSWFASTMPTNMEVHLLRLVGVLFLALAIGCWPARGGDRSAMRLLVGTVALAAAGATVIMVMMALDGPFSPLFWINPIITGVLCLLNAWQWQTAH